jgi:hypothetical protein
MNPLKLICATELLAGINYPNSKAEKSALCELIDGVANGDVS